MASLAPSAERLARNLHGAVLNAAEQAAGGAGGDDAARLAPLAALLAAGACADYNLARAGASEVVTPLLCAVRAGDQAAALKLLESRPAGARDVGSPLSAALTLAKRMLPALLAAGCDPCAGCAADGGGANALHAAVRAGVSPDTLRALFASCGGDDRLSAALLAQDGTGGTPLLWAARAEAADVTLTALLIDAPGGRAAVNVADRGCDTPLRVATGVDCVRLLLAAGADAASRNRCSTVIGAQLARGAPAEVIVALLQGARPFSK